MAALADQPRRFSFRKVLHLKGGSEHARPTSEVIRSSAHLEAQESAKEVARPTSVVLGENGVVRDAGEEWKIEVTAGRRERALPSIPVAAKPLPPPPKSPAIFSIPEVPEDGEDGPDVVQQLADEGVMQKVVAGPVTISAERVLNKVDDTVAKVTDSQGVVAKYIAPIQNVLDASGATQAIQSGLTSFMEDIPWLMKALDEVARIHPVVTVAVLAFKAVYNMELTRRENDRKIWSLHAEMKDMISVLVQLRDLKDPKDVGPDGRTIEARLQGVSKKTADDIKNCANACDTYSKKRLLVKVLQGYVWEAKLVEFVGTFTQRRTEFEQALTMHIARTVHTMDATLVSVKLTTDAINEKMASFMRAFETLISPEEAEMRDMILQKGDFKAVQNNDNILQELSDEESRLEPRKATQGIRGNTVKDLKLELRSNLDSVLKKNLETFEGKFELYNRQLKEELSQFIHEENRQIISIIREGPYEKIENEELRGIWKEMNWRRNVKSRLFVMTLRDHFREKVEDVKLAIASGSYDFLGMAKTDNWALRYVGVSYLHSIMEAFDDDGSGYITISEVNAFTRGLPSALGWSLQHWIAYWAVGWQVTTQVYRDKIHDIFARMFTMRTTLLPENRYGADYYLNTVWSSIVELTAAFKKDDACDDAQLLPKFMPYAQMEEDRIRRNLLDIRYDIDALDTVYVVAGRGRIEKYLLTLIYLLLQRDLAIFSVGRRRVLHPDEFPNSAASLAWVLDAAVYRVQDLSEFYRQHKLDLTGQFQSAACGLFAYYNDNRPLWSMKSLEDPPFGNDSEGRNDPMSTDIFSSPESLLTYRPSEESPFVLCGYVNSAVFDAQPSTASSSLYAILGTWNGFIYAADEYPYYPMTSLTFRPSSCDAESFEASGRHYSNEVFSLQGRLSPEPSGTLRVAFCMSFASGPEYFSGSIDQTGAMIGYRGWDEGVSEATHNDMFILKRVPEAVMCHHPCPDELAQNQPRALWNFAISFVLEDVRRRSWSWSYFRERRRVRKRYLELNIRFGDYGRTLDEAESKEYLQLRRSLTLADAMYYRSLGDYMTHVMPRHHGFTCDGCARQLGGGRLMCMDCPPQSADNFTDSIDFCDLTCAQTVVTSAERDYLEEGSPHTPEHDLIKVRSVLSYRDIPELRKKASQVIRYARLRLDLPGNPAEVAAIVPGDGNVVAQPPCCNSCRSTLRQSCWCCIECSDTFLCDDCESSSLLPCKACARPFMQPSWYYGQVTSTANFLCNRCELKRASGKPLLDEGKDFPEHIYTHALVRVKERVVTVAPPSPPSSEDRLFALEKKMEDVDAKLDRLETQLSGRLQDMEQTLESLQRAMTLMLSRYPANGSAT